MVVELAVRRNRSLLIRELSEQRSTALSRVLTATSPAVATDSAPTPTRSIILYVDTLLVLLVVVVVVVDVVDVNIAAV